MAREKERNQFKFLKHKALMVHHSIVTALDVMSECTALLGWKLGFRGVLDSGFSSCTTPTYYCRSEYFYRSVSTSSEVNWNRV